MTTHKYPAKDIYLYLNLFRSRTSLMAITKRTELKEEILPNQTIQIRTTTVVEEDGVELARNHHRHVVNPGDDVTGEAQEVQDIAAVLWTDEVIAAYQASIAPPAESE